MYGGPGGRGPAPEMRLAGSPKPQMCPQGPLDPPSGPREVAGGCPAPSVRPTRAHRPLQSRRGPRRGSVSRASPCGGLSSPARLFLDSPPRSRRPSAHHCGGRVALQDAFRAQAPARPRTHWLVALCPRSLARSTPELIGPSCPGAGTASLRPPGRWPLSCLPVSGLRPDPIGSAKPQRNRGRRRGWGKRTNFQPRRIPRVRKLKGTVG